MILFLYAVSHFRYHSKTKEGKGISISNTSNVTNSTLVCRGSTPAEGISSIISTQMFVLASKSATNPPNQEPVIDIMDTVLEVFQRSGGFKRGKKLPV